MRGQVVSDGGRPRRLKGTTYATGGREGRALGLESRPAFVDDAPPAAATAGTGAALDRICIDDELDAGGFGERDSAGVERLEPATTTAASITSMSLSSSSSSATATIASTSGDGL
jgi:hypothetical protein